MTTDTGMGVEAPNYERIYLQPFAGDEGGHTWCSERIDNDDVEYVRADLYATLTARVEELEGALRPFAGDKLPGNNRTERDYNRFGLRCLMSPMELARRNAFFALHPEEHPLAKSAALFPKGEPDGQ